MIMTITATATRTAREYARSSKGKGGRSKSTADQHADNLRAEREFGPWTWGAPYADTGSASKYARKIRDDFEKLLADLASGAFGEPGTVLVLWEISRLSREMGVGTKIVDLCETGGYLIHITSDERTYNPANYNDRHALQAGINDAEREAGRLSKRTIRGVDSNLNATDDDGAPAARPHGIIPFGYQREYAFQDGRPRPVRQFEQPEEAEIVRELFRRVLAGESIRAVSTDFTARGITSRGGVPFSAATLRVTLTKDAYRGYRVHGKQTIKASWPAIIDDATWHGVQKLLDDPSRRSHTGEGVRHVLSMIIKCGVCGGAMTVTYRRAQKTPLPPAYQCRANACVRITKDGVDDVVIGDILAFLADPDVYRRLAPGTQDGGDAAAVRTQLSLKRGQLKAFENEDPETPAEARLIGRKIEKLTAEIAGLEAEERDLSQPSRLSAIFPADPGKDVRGRWDALPVTARREIAAMLLTPQLLGEVRIMRAPAPGTVVPAEDRIVWHTED